MWIRLHHLQHYLQLVDALLIGACIWGVHTLCGRGDVAGSFWWMIALALPLSPLALEFLGFYRLAPDASSERILSRSMAAMILVNLAILTFAAFFPSLKQTIGIFLLSLSFLAASLLLTFRTLLTLHFLKSDVSRSPC